MKDNKANESNKANEIKKSDELKKYKHARIITVIVCCVIVISLIIYGGTWFMESYEPDTFSLIAMQSTDIVTVDDTDDYIAFIPIGSDSQVNKSPAIAQPATPIEGTELILNPVPGLIFYPGAKVEPEAYAVMAHRLAEAGIPVIIAKMPFNFAVLDPDKAMALKQTLGISEKWTIGGHSLGGSMAAKVVYENPDAFNALILFASYPGNDLSSSGLNVLSISGTRDAIVTKSKIDEKKPFLPLQTIYLEIEGGNHAQFGNYGQQKGDNQATITSEAQMDQIVDAVITFMGGLK